MSLEGKVAIIAGAGQRPGEGVGNGRATAMLFAREGAKVILANRSIGSVEETRDLLKREGFEADCMACDISKEEDCSALIVLPDWDSSKIELKDWQATIDVNLTGAMLITKQVLPAMRSQRSGCITHTSSIAAVASYPYIAYKVSKAALHDYARWVAFENAPYNIRCNVLMLGLVDTPMGIEYHHQTTGKSREVLRKERSETVPMKRMGTPWETAHAAVFLASDHAAYIRGAVLPLDGGLHTRIG
jgi:NAD(P)-dependent dehydrogenase (short-subunit alcohol dehydrogenase family)